MAAVNTTALTHMVRSPVAVHLDINSPLMDFTVKVRHSRRLRCGLGSLCRFIDFSYLRVLRNNRLYYGMRCACALANHVTCCRGYKPGVFSLTLVSIGSGLHSLSACSV